MSTDRLAWLEARRKSIGSSDVAKILGLSPWGTALDVYLDKVNPVGTQSKMPAPLEWGIRLEPAIAAAVQDHYGWPLAKVPIQYHADHPFLSANIDRKNDAAEPCEIKSSERAVDWGEPDTDEIPEQYWLQCQHQLEVAASHDPNVDVCWVFLLVGQCDFRRYKVVRDPAYLSLVLDPLREFWTHVEERIPPEPDWSHPTTIDAVKRMFKPKPGKAIPLPELAIELLDEYESLGDEIGLMKERRDAVKAKLIVAIGDAEVGELDDGRSISRPLVQRKEYVVNATEYHDFRIKKAKVRR